MKKISSLFLLISSISCSNLEMNKESSSAQNMFFDFFKSKGVVSFTYSDNCLLKDVLVYNADGTEYFSLNFNESKYRYKDSSVVLENSNDLKNLEMFNPMEFYPDYNILRFEYANVLGNNYYVYIDKEKTVLKHIVIDSQSCFEVKPWKNYFLGSMVDTDFIKNPMRKSNTDDSEQVNEHLNYDDYFFLITAIKGEWIKIECADLCGFVCNPKISGWIRWKKDGIKLISLPSSC